METELTKAMRKKHSWNVIDYDNPVNMPPLNTTVHILVEQDIVQDTDFDAPEVVTNVQLIEIDPTTNYGATRRWVENRVTAGHRPSAIRQSETVVAWRLKI